MWEIFAISSIVIKRYVQAVNIFAIGKKKYFIPLVFTSYTYGYAFNPHW